jgi:hypothetical protein
MPWTLTADTYWREEGEDVVLVNPRSILRLNAVSARAFRALVDLDHPPAGPAVEQPEDSELVRLLRGEGMIAPAGDGPADPRRRHLAHLGAPGGPS